MINFNFSKDCCGCRVCGDRCPKKCISFHTNKYGWDIPQVDLDNCIQCGICEKVCPHLSYKKPLSTNPRLFSAYASDESIRKEGSSGSIFYLMARNIITNGGKVYGAGFDDNLKLRHYGVDVIDELQPLMKSKYIQSNTTGVYNDVIKEIRTGRKVMFVGTPCQCVALYQALNNNLPDNLLLVDFICHGVPGQQLFDRAIENFEFENKCKVTSFSFRKKLPNRLRGYSISYTSISDSSTHYEEGTSSKFPYYCGYLKYYTFRDSCYKCSYLGKNRVSDITLGDFWFLDTIRPISDFNKGYSMLIINSNRGLLEFNRLKLSQEIVTEEFNIEEAVRLNQAYTHPAHMSIVHRFFKRDYNRLDWQKLVKRYFLPRAPFFQKCLRYIIIKTGI